MRQSGIFWGFVLVIVGTLLLLNNLNFLQVSWGVIWALFLVALGLWFLWGAWAAPRRAVDVETATIPLSGADRAEVKIEHGAGTLTLTAGAPADALLTGRFGGGLECHTKRDEGGVEARLRPAIAAWFLWPWNWRGPLDWDIQFNDAVPLYLKIEAGAGRAHLDLTDLRVAALKLSTGASSTRLTLPAQAGFTRAKIEAGAAGVEITVPGGVAACVRTEGGLAAIEIDASRFPRFGDEYRSPAYESAANKVEIEIEAGVGAVKVQ